MYYSGITQFIGHSARGLHQSNSIVNMSNNKVTKEDVSFPIKPPGPPKVWKVVEIVPKGSKGAKGPLKVSIQEIPEDRYQEVADYMCTYFIPDEPICRSLNGKNDPDYVESFRMMWGELMQQGLSVGAFVENPDGGKPIMAGVNALAIAYEGEKFDCDKFKSEKAKRVMKVIEGICDKAQVFEKYGVDRYMAALGLSVHPSYRGAALGGHLLNAREDIGREYKIAVTSTAFTSRISQKLAERCGFETLVEKSYDEIVDEQGNPLFPVVESKSVKVMAKRLY